MTKKSNNFARTCLAVGLILTAIFAVVGSIKTYRMISLGKSIFGHYSEIGPLKRESILAISSDATAQERLVVKTMYDGINNNDGYLNKKGDDSAAKKLHELDKYNKVYLANYTLNCISSKRFKLAFESDSDYQKIMKDPKLKAQFFAKNKRVLELLSYAEKIDPDNALYNYLKACTIFSEASVLESSKKNRRTIGDDRYKIVDPKKLNTALNEFKKGLAKPYYRAYALDLVMQRIEILMPNPVSFQDHIKKIDIGAQTILPCLGMMRNLTRQIKTAIIYNQKQGNYQECENLIKTWKPFVQQQFKGNDFLIGYLVTKAISNIYFTTASEYYHERENKKLASYYDQKIALNKVKLSEKGTCKLPRERLGVLGHMLLTGLPIFEKQEEINEKLSSQTIVDYKLIEQFVVVALSVVVFLMLLIYGLIVIFSKNDAQYLKLNNKELLLVIGAGLIGPLVFYLTITNIDALSGREFSFKYNCRIIPQLLLLIASIILPLNIAMKHVVRNHCLKEGVDAPKGKISLSIMAGVYMLLIITAIVGIPFVVFNRNYIVQWYIDYQWLYSHPLNYIWILSIIVFFVILIVCGAKYVISAKKYKLFYKLFQKNFTLYLAIFPIMLLLIFFAIFKYQEYYYIEKDELLFAKTNKGESLTPLETRGTQKLKELFKKEILDK